MRGVAIFLLFGLTTVVYGSLALSLSLEASSAQVEDSSSRETASDTRRLSSFRFLDTKGEFFASETLEGKLWLANFFFSSCPHICPAVHGRIAGLAQEFQGEEEMRIVSFSVDPLRDTPEALRVYEQRFQLDPQWWVFLTSDTEGKTDSISEVMEKQFLLASHGNPAQHTRRLVLLSPGGEILDYYDSESDEDIERLRADIRSALKKYFP